MMLDIRNWNVVKIVVLRQKTNGVIEKPFYLPGLDREVAVLFK